MDSLAGFLGFALLQSIVLCALFVVLCDLSRRMFKLDDLLTFCGAVLLLGVLGYAAFWIAFANYRVYTFCKIATLAVLLIRFSWIVWQRRLGEYRWLAEPLAFTFLYFAAVLSLGFSAGGLDHPEVTAQNRFSHPLPIDNVVPLIVSLALRADHFASPLFGDWLMSDRPPLQTGLYLLLTLRGHPLAYQIVATWLQATFLFGVWGLTVAAALPVAARRLVLLACCLLPTALINTFFAWPKMLSVGYLLLVFALLFWRSPRDGYERKIFGVMIGGLTALSVLSHGSSLFALLGFAAVVLLFWAWPPLKTMMWSAVTAAVLYAPWILFQNVYDPPANRLLKWHFAGVIEVDGRSFLTALRDSYGALTSHEYLQGKLANIAPLIGPWPWSVVQTTRDILTFSTWDPPGVRSNDFFLLLPSLHGYSFALISAILLLPFMAQWRSQRAVVLRILVALAATCTVFVLLIFLPGQTINHHGTYAIQVMATVGAFIVLTLRARWLALAFIALQAVTLSAAYAFTLKHDPAYWPLLAVCVAAMLALVAFSLAPSLRRTG